MGKIEKILLGATIAFTYGASFACRTVDTIPTPIVSPAIPGTIPASLGARETPRPPVTAMATAKNTACMAEVNPNVLPPLPNNLTLAGQGPGSFYYEMEKTDLGQQVREATSYMLAARLWQELGYPNFYTSAELNKPNNPGDLLKIIADIAQCAYEKPISKVEVLTLFDVSKPTTFKAIQQVTALLNKRAKNSASLPPLADYYPPGQSDQTYASIDKDLEKLVLATLETTLKNMGASGNPTLKQYAQVLDSLRRGQSPADPYTFGYQNQYYIAGPLPVRVPTYYDAAGYIAMTTNNTTLTDGRSDGNFLFTIEGLYLAPSSWLAMTDSARQVIIAKELARRNSTFGAMNATIIRGKK